jgi:hypothetical protein
MCIEHITERVERMHLDDLASLDLGPAPMCVCECYVVCYIVCVSLYVLVNIYLCYMGMIHKYMCIVYVIYMLYIYVRTCL